MWVLSLDIVTFERISMIYADRGPPFLLVGISMPLSGAKVDSDWSDPHMRCLKAWR